MSSTIAIVLALLLVVLLLVVIGFLTYDALVRKSGTGLLLMIGLLVLFGGERVFGEGDWRMPVSAFGLVIVLGAVALRGYTWSTSTGGRREGHQIALAWSAVAVGSLLLYALTLSPVTSALGFDEEKAASWSAVWRAIFPIFTMLGLLPALRMDQILSVHPVVMPAGAARSAQIQGVTAALLIALMFPVNYIAKQHDVEWDVAYFRTTRPGESTLAMVRTFATPVEVILFFPSSSDVANEVRPYFDELSKASGGLMTTRVVDQAFDPKLAEELKVRDNGQIVLKQGETNEKFKLDTELDKAKHDLKKLDSLVQKHLLKLTRGARTVYFLSGHGEANWRDNEEVFRKINVYKKDALEAQNFKVKTFGMADGSTSQVPDDADIVVVAAPMKPLLPEEVETLNKYFDAGGSVFVMVDPAGDPLTDLLAHLGVETGKTILGNAENHARVYGGIKDNVLIGTNKYGSHPAVKTLSRNSQTMHMWTPNAVSVQKKADGTSKVTTLIRSMPNTWADTNGNFVDDPDEEKKVYDLAVATTLDVGEGEDKKEARAIVMGTVGSVSDLAITNLQANQVFVLDSVRWLNHDEDIAGEVETEEDVKVQHTREEDWMWFLTAILAVPAMVLGVGVMFIRLRGRNS